jgi:hypothetical protein
MRANAHRTKPNLRGVAPYETCARDAFCVNSGRSFRRSGKGRKDINFDDVGCVFWRSLKSVCGVFARYRAIAMTFRLRFIL